MGRLLRPPPRSEFQVGTNERLLTATLREDNPLRLALTLADDSGHWTVEIDVEHRRLPMVSVSGTLDLTALSRADGTPGCLAGVLGGGGEGTAILDFAPIEDDGRLIDAQGRANQFRGSVRLETRTSATRWTLEGNGALHARGLARPILWFAGRRMRRSIDHSLGKFWTESESGMPELDAELRRLQSAIEAQRAARPPTFGAPFGTMTPTQALKHCEGPAHEAQPHLDVVRSLRMG